MFETALALSVLALTLRGVGAAARAKRSSTPALLIGWMLCGVAGWLSTGAAGAYAPLWLPCAISLLCAIAAMFVSIRGLRSLHDVAVVFACGLASTPHMGLLQTCIVAIVFLLAGQLLDRMTAGTPRLPATLIAGSAAFALSLFLFVAAVKCHSPHTNLAWTILNLGITPLRVGQRVDLPTGSVAWLDMPTAEPNGCAAVLLHGADPLGSRQKSANVQRRAMLTNGWIVFSVDYQGYGETPNPSLDGPPEQWDPAPRINSAIDYVRELDGVDRVYLTGHSMGTSTVFRLLDQRADIDGAIIFGPAVLHVPKENRKWYGRFHQDRRLNERIDFETWQIIFDRYLDNRSILRRCTLESAPLLHIRTSEDFEDGRLIDDPLDELIRFQRAQWHWPQSTHYMSSSDFRGCMFGDTRIARQLAHRLQYFDHESTSNPIAMDRADFSSYRAVDQWYPHRDWTLRNDSYEGNPFDLEATAVFEHQESGTTITTGMFYSGWNTWTLRFTGIHPGTWTFLTHSDDPDLDAITGSIVVRSQQGQPGFVSGRQEKWIRTGTDDAFVPQYVMYAGPNLFFNDPERIDRDIEEFIVKHGFTGFHVPVLARWFDLDKPSTPTIDEPSPDLRTFEALELLITKTYEAGGVVHLWMWGDDQRRMSPTKWGINSEADKRLQRYIAARLGPLPGWTMGYGFDLWEWVTPAQLEQWHAYLHEHFGWPHMLGARGRRDDFTEIFDDLDYSSYEQRHPDYEKYAKTIQLDPRSPSFSEDRFRIRGLAKDYTMEQVRRGLWNSAMAGGVANIWGNLAGDTADGWDGSKPFPEPHWIRTYGTFFEARFLSDMERAPQLTDGRCLHTPDARAFVFYREAADSIWLDLSGAPGPMPAVAVDALKPYEEINLGLLPPHKQTWKAPYSSDWAIAVGTFEEKSSPELNAAIDSAESP